MYFLPEDKDFSEKKTNNCQIGIGEFSEHVPGQDHSIT